MCAITLIVIIRRGSAEFALGHFNFELTRVNLTPYKTYADETWPDRLSARNGRAAVKPIGIRFTTERMRTTSVVGLCFFGNY